MKILKRRRYIHFVRNLMINFVVKMLLKQLFDPACMEGGGFWGQNVGQPRMASDF